MQQRDAAECATRARDLLGPLLFGDDSHEFDDERRNEILSLLARAAGRGDPALADLLEGQRVAMGTHRAEDVLRAFYFGGAGTGRSHGERAFAAKRELADSLRRGRTFINEDFFIEFLKHYSSFSPLLTSADPESLGGGYFAALGGSGCVVDPGHHFLDNFFARGRSVHDVDCILVTHFHDDHFADLPALLSLLHQRHERERREGSAPSQVRLLADEQTLRMFRPIIDSSEYIARPRRLSPNATPWYSLNAAVSVRALPAKHKVWRKRRGAVGLAFRMRRARPAYLIITSDTGWDERVEAAYRRFRGKDVTLVAHLSSASRDEVAVAFSRQPDASSKDHLCVHGVCKAIEAVRPKAVVLSEVGEELRDVVHPLADIIARVYGIECDVCLLGLQRHL
jgi:ribonuclease BN (tRNA processing enzyme)